MRSGRHREGVHREDVARQRRLVTSSTRAGVCSKRLLGEIALQLDTRILRYVFAPRRRLSQQYTCSSPTAADPPLPHHHYDIPSAGASRLCSRQLVMLNLYLLITAAKEVMFSSAFVCLLAGLCKNIPPIFTKFDGKVAHGPTKRRLDFGRNPDLNPDPGIFEGTLPLQYLCF